MTVDRVARLRFIADELDSPADDVTGADDVTEILPPDMVCDLNVSKGGR